MEVVSVNMLAYWGMDINISAPSYFLFQVVKICFLATGPMDLYRWIESASKYFISSIYKLYNQAGQISNFL